MDLFLSRRNGFYWSQQTFSLEASLRNIRVGTSAAPLCVKSIKALFQCSNFRSRRLPTFHSGASTQRTVGFRARRQPSGPRDAARRMLIALLCCGHTALAARSRSEDAQFLIQVPDRLDFLGLFSTSNGRISEF